MGYKRASFEAIGTRWEIRADYSGDRPGWSRLMDRISKRVASFDQTYSRFRPDSLVARMAKCPGTYRLPPDGYRLLHFYERLYQATGGKITPLIGQVIADAGYDASYSFQAKPLHTPAAWDEVISLTRRNVTLHQPALLDFGAAGKGYLVDLVKDIIEQDGIASFVINAGGDIAHRSATSTPLFIGLENPFDASEAVGIAQLANKSLCASAGSKRQWGGRHHIIDPESLQSPDAIVATWVIAADTLTADGIATALFFCDPAALRLRFSFTYAILHRGMAMTYAPDFPVTVFQAETHAALR